jgi:AcrR family transcriptional regulator
LADQEAGENDPQREQSKREVRAERILDAAAALIQRWGYNKTTIDDIARQAGVAKGTIYLHWKTREALFMALLTREYLIVVQDFRQRMLGDPENIMPHGLLKQAFLLSMSRPLIKAMLLGDKVVLGELVRRDYADPTSVTQRRVAFGRYYVELLRGKGLMRTDISAVKQLHMLSAIATGFMVADQFMPDEYKVSLEESAEMLAETVRHTFEPDGPLPLEKVQEVQGLFIQHFDQLIQAIKERFQKEAGA